MHNLNIDFMKPAFAVFVAWGISMTDATEVLKFSAALVAFGYAVWKWRKDVKGK